MYTHKNICFYVYINVLIFNSIKNDDKRLNKEFVTNIKSSKVSLIFIFLHVLYIYIISLT